MTNSIIKEVYASPNGDKWALARNGEGKLVVYHQPNRASGGVVSEIAVDVFLSHAEQGPEYQALSAALAELKLSDKHLDDSESDATVAEKMDRTLGQAVVRCWSRLAPEIQQTLFEAAVQAEGESIRQVLAMHLHDKHERTIQSVQAKAMPEPDSLGG
jgi:hypothetical protein